MHHSNGHSQKASAVKGFFAIMNRDADPPSSSAASSKADVLECLDVVSELSAGFDTSTVVSTGGCQSSPISGSGVFIFRSITPLSS